MPLLWLADVLRDAGVTVVEHPDWRTRAVSGAWSPTFGVVHATAAPQTQSDATQVRLVRDGHSTLAGPIANACIDHDGRWHVLSAGRCNSTLDGTAGPYRGLGNSRALSVEACNDNRGEPWPAVQYDAYVRGWAAWCARLGWSASNLVGHKEHTPVRKSDPTFDMRVFRAAVARLISGGAPAPEGEDMPKFWRLPNGAVGSTTGTWRYAYQTVEEFDAALAMWGASRSAAVLIKPELLDAYGQQSNGLVPGVLTEEELAELAEDIAEEIIEQGGVTGGVTEDEARAIAREVVDGADVVPGA